MGIFSFLTFKQDISCNDICMRNCHHSFYPWWMVVEDALNHVFINGFIYEHHIIVSKKKARKGLLLGEILVFMGHKHGWFLIHSNSSSNYSFMRWRWITKAMMEDNCIAIHTRVKLVGSGLPNLVHDSFHCANFSCFLSKHKNGHLLMWKQCRIPITETKGFTFWMESIVHQ